MHISHTHTMSGCSRLSLLPVDKIERFAVVRGRAHLLFMGSQLPSHEVPGTLRATTLTEDGKYMISITYTFCRFDEFAHLYVHNLSSMRFVAVFYDEVGRLRIAGSPDYPLKLSSEESDGVIRITMRGETDGLNPFLLAGESFF